MIGYVKAEKPELKVKDFEIYSGYYCGVCKSIGSNYGQIPRLALSYDAAFLALILDGLKEETYNVSREHCIIHPIKKKTILRSDAIDYAADIMLILAWYKMEDDVIDEAKLSARLGKMVLKKTFKGINNRYYELSRSIRENLDHLHRLEREKCSSLDEVSHPFAKIMEELFTSYFEDMDEEENRLLKKLGYDLGKWIYLIDAFDDLEEDIKKKRYNPLIYRLSINRKLWGRNRERYMESVRALCQQNLFIYGGQLRETVDSMNFYKNKDIIVNIVSMGLLRSVETILDKEKEGEKDGSI